MLKRPKEFNVKLNDSKCEYGTPKVKWLGHELSCEGVKPSVDKVGAIKSFREPKTKEETRSFLGLVTYVGRFIPNLATLTEPLRKLTKKDEKFVWESE